MYFSGYGIPKDYVAALMWINLAAAQSDEKIINLRDDLTKLMTHADVAKAQGLAHVWLAKGVSEIQATADRRQEGRAAAGDR